MRLFPCCLLVAIVFILHAEVATAAADSFFWSDEEAWAKNLKTTGLKNCLPETEDDTTPELQFWLTVSQEGSVEMTALKSTAPRLDSPKVAAECIQQALKKRRFRLKGKRSELLVILGGENGVSGLVVQPENPSIKSPKTLACKKVFEKTNRPCEENREPQKAKKPAAISSHGCITSTADYAKGQNPSVNLQKPTLMELAGTWVNPCIEMPMHQQLESHEITIRDTQLTVTRFFGAKAKSPLASRTNYKVKVMTSKKKTVVSLDKTSADVAFLESGSVEWANKSKYCHFAEWAKGVYRDAKGCETVYDYFFDVDQGKPEKTSYRSLVIAKGQLLMGTNEASAATASSACDDNPKSCLMIFIRQN